jgi:hypothetical protein
MGKMNFHPEPVDITWTFCGVALFQRGLLVGPALIVTKMRGRLA